MEKTFLLLLMLLSSLSGRLIAQGLKQNKTTVQERITNVDFSKSSGKLNMMFNECVGAGRANEGLRAGWQQQLAYVRKECGFKYIHTNARPNNCFMIWNCRIEN